MLPSPQPVKCSFRFGAFEFNAETTELTRNGAVVRLQPQPARLLLLLLSNAGGLVSRETIQASLWRDGTTVDFEIGVNRCVRQLRAALSDDSVAPRYVRTVPRLGYSFIAPVSAPQAAPSADETPARMDGSEASEKPSIAVLPFTNLSNAPDDEYFSDGLTEEVINALTQIPGLKVIARTSAFAFKGRNEDIRGIAKALGVTTVLEGSVRRMGSRIRITSQLIRADDGTHLSSKRYDRELNDVFAIQDEISADIAEQLRIRFAGHRQTVTDLGAYRAYLEGRYHLYKFSPNSLARAFECFQRAASIDPHYSPAYSGMAWYYFGLAIDTVAPPRDALAKAAAAARRALEWDETNAEACAVLGAVAALLDFDWAVAEEYFLRARSLNPAVQVRIAYALWFLLPQGRLSEAIAEFDRVIEQDPLVPGGYNGKSMVLFQDRKFEAAAEHSLRALEVDPGFPRALQSMAHIRALQGRFCRSKWLREAADSRSWEVIDSPVYPWE